MSKQPNINDLTKKNVEAIAAMRRESDKGRSSGERVADAAAAFIGSWPFIIGQSAVLAAWMTINCIAWFYMWDPYPFILLNLVLSFQAAFSSPIIMMSQNRQAKIDTRRNQLDLQINMLAEQENTEMIILLRLLCEKAGIQIEQHRFKGAFEEVASPQEMARQIERAELAPPRASD